MVMTRAGDEAAEEQRADRDVAHHAVDHERQRRRDDRPERGGRRGDADREFGVVAVVLHRLDFDGAETGGVRDRGAGHAGEDHRAEDVHMGETAAHPAAGRHREIIDAVGDPGRIHQIAGEDEERHRQQRKTVEAAGHAVQDHEVGNARDEVGVEQRRARQRDEHGNADQQVARRRRKSGSGIGRCFQSAGIWCGNVGRAASRARAWVQTA